MHMHKQWTHIHTNAHTHKHTHTNTHTHTHTQSRMHINKAYSSVQGTDVYKFLGNSTHATKEWKCAVHNKQTHKRHPYPVYSQGLESFKVHEKVCKPLNDSHTIFLWIEAVTWFWKSCEHRCCFIKHLPCSSCCQLAFSTKGRNSVTTCECTPESIPPHLSPKTAAKLWIGTQRLFTTASNSKLSCLSPVEAKPSKQEMAVTTISVSAVTTVITSWSWLARFLTFTKILVSASSWLHGPVEFC